jgi:aminoglycoside phosphotransferase (APT) family kinase protein
MIKLEPIKVRCAWPVYKATTDEGKVVFVKVTTPEALKKTFRCLSAAGRCRFLPKIVPLEIPELSGKEYLCLEWIDAKYINAEDMTDAQADSLLTGYLQFSDAIAQIKDVPARKEEEKTEFFYAQIMQYAKHHPVAAMFIRDLIDIPEDLRSCSNRKLVCIHGDFQPLNYGFCGEEFSAVFDFESITYALACEDIAYAFTERARRSSLSDRKRKRLCELFVRCMHNSPWPEEEWMIAINRSRLRIAAHRIAKHPNSPFTAIDVAHRDKYLRKFQNAVGGRLRSKMV